MKNQPLSLEFNSQKPDNETTYAISYGVKLELVCSNSTSQGSIIKISWKFPRLYNFKRLSDNQTILVTYCCFDEI